MWSTCSSWRTTGVVRSTDRAHSSRPTRHTDTQRSNRPGGMSPFGPVFHRSTQPDRKTMTATRGNSCHLRCVPVAVHTPSRSEPTAVCGTATVRTARPGPSRQPTHHPRRRSPAIPHAVTSCGHSKRLVWTSHRHGPCPVVPAWRSDRRRILIGCNAAHNCV